MLDSCARPLFLEAGQCPLAPEESPYRRADLLVPGVGPREGYRAPRLKATSRSVAEGQVLTSARQAFAVKPSPGSISPLADADLRGHEKGSPRHGRYLPGAPRGNHSPPHVHLVLWGPALRDAVDSGSTAKRSDA